MRRLLLRLLFRILEGATMKQIPQHRKTELSLQLAKLYEDGIFQLWLDERELLIYNIWKSGAGEKDDIARGRIFELEAIKRTIKERYNAEQKRKEKLEESRRK